MTVFALSLIMASFVGTIIWIVQTSVKPITQKLFSQTWHYYTSFIPVFFLLGGSAIINRLGPLIRSILTDSSTSPPAGKMTEPFIHVLPIEQTASHRSFLNQPFISLSRLENLQEIVLTAILIWAAGTIVFIAVNVKNYRTFKRSILQNSRVCETVDCPVKVIVSSHATTPMVMGLWKPFVVLPDTPLDEKELDMIISHELVHLKRGDLVMKLIILVVNAIHWFNPAAYVLNKQLNTLCELSCDEKVVRDMDMESRRLYGETLLKMLEYGVMKRNVVCTSSLCTPKKNMKRRLVNLMSVKKLNKFIIMMSLASTISMVGIGGLVASAAESAVPPKAVPSKAVPPKIPTDKKPQGRNVYVQMADGTVLYYDKDGNVTEAPEMRKSLTPPDYTTEEVVEIMKQLINDHSSVPYNSSIPIELFIPQHFVDQLPQKYLDEINKTYGLELKKTESFTTEELVALTKKGIEKNTVPQAYVDALPQKELDAINKTYGWELKKSN
ncbi:M56 family metallopeptidase [Paenibacillus azoreducens]|uniref:M56 family metallopeptidase n=1 Tax=Paenibacillus azoreducens TaxID=116718 RepID=UPI0039F5E781